MSAPHVVNVTYPAVMVRSALWYPHSALLNFTILASAGKALNTTVGVANVPQVAAVYCNDTLYSHWEAIDETSISISVIGLLFDALFSVVVVV
eukprot:m.672341 g.672341  ORF g.672341 m.672341 type:complete len:93 (+) comp58535_c0_seq1:1807-2085(+)